MRKKGVKEGGSAGGVMGTIYSWSCSIPGTVTGRTRVMLAPDTRLEETSFFFFCLFVRLSEAVLT